MKRRIKIISIMIGIFMILTSIKVYAAASYSVELSGVSTVAQGEEITVTLKLKDLVDIGGIDGKINVLQGKLTYDSTKLDKVESKSSGLNGFSMTWGSVLVLDSVTGVSGETEIASLTFQAKEEASIGSTAITLTEIKGSNGEADIVASDVSKSINITEASEEPVESSNNNLTSISIDGAVITGFNKNTLTYTLAAVENSKTSIHITVALEDSKASVTGTGTKTLVVGNNSFQIVVTAEDGSTKTYVIQVERKAATGETTKELPKAGVVGITGAGIASILGMGIFSYTKIRRYKGI